MGGAKFLIHSYVNVLVLFFCQWPMVIKDTYFDVKPINLTMVRLKLKSK